MDLWEAVLLGVLQGLTEFLPVSSSGHLVLAQAALGIDQPGVALEVAVHLGTLGSVLVHYRKDVAEILRGLVVGGPGRRLGLLVLLATLPTVAIYMLLQDRFDAALDSPIAAAFGLIATGLFLLFTLRGRRTDDEPGAAHALVVGVAQGIAILPGVSRSGSTIGIALLMGEDPVRAARFSFLLSIPAILGAAVLTAAHGFGPGEVDPVPLAVAGFVAFASGWAAIALLLRVLARGRLSWFGPYCVIAGVVALVLFA